MTPGFYFIIPKYILAVQIVTPTFSATFYQWAHTPQLLLEGGTRTEGEKMCYQINTSWLRDTIQ